MSGGASKKQRSLVHEGWSSEKELISDPMRGSDLNALRLMSALRSAPGSVIAQM
jgi:hypothetical protein